MPKRSHSVPTRSESRAAVRLMLQVSVGCIIASALLVKLGLPRGYGAVVVGVGLVYVIGVGHDASWPRRVTPSAFPLRVAVVTGVLICLTSVLATWLLVLADAASAVGVSIVSLVVTYYWIAWWLRSLVADAPRLRDARAFIWLLLICGLGLVVAYAFGLSVAHNRIGDFYASTAQVGATLLVAAALQSAWARRVQAYEGIVLVTMAALVLSLAGSFISLAASDDSAYTFALTIVGLTSGVYLVGFGAVHQIAPDLLRPWTVRGETNYVSDQLYALNWTVDRLRGWRRSRYDLKAVRGGKTIYVAVASSSVRAHPSLTDGQWHGARRKGSSYVLAVVDYFGTEWQTSWFVRDPTANEHMSGRSSTPLCLQRPPLEKRAIDAASL